MILTLDLHIHTNSSYDSVMSLEKVVAGAQRKRINVIAITDHDVINDCKVLDNVAMASGIHIVCGVEISTKDAGDILGLFVRRPLCSHGTALETIEAIHSQDGIAVLAHPFKRRKSIPPDIIRQVDALEGINSRCDWSRNLRAIELARRYNKPMLASSDAHFGFEIGRAVTYLKVRDADVDCEGSIKAEALSREILHGSRILVGMHSSHLVEGMSQFIKGAKSGKVNPFVQAALNFFWGIPDCFRTTHMRRIFQARSIDSL